MATSKTRKPKRTASTKGEYVRKNKQCGKTAESEARRMANLRNAPAAPKGNNRAVTHGLRSKQPWTLPGAESTEARIRESLDGFEPIQPQDEEAVHQLIGTAQLIDHCHRDLAANLDVPLAKRQLIIRNLAQLKRTMNDQLADLAMTVRSRADLGLAVAKTAAVEIKPVRNLDRASEVAGFLSELGVIPQRIAPRSDDIDADTAEYGGDPEPLSEAALRDLGVRSIHNKEND